ncbi:hypothetical protein BJ917_5970 [Pseudomonas sp. WPR_5_2]|nr:hypothetical protein BJ917_5970 [Pseudomonas sp. WPR_5_2]
MKPPRKPKPGTPETDPSIRNNQGEDGRTPWHHLPDPNIPGPAIDLPGNQRPEGQSDNSPQGPSIVVVDISTPGPLVISPSGITSDINFLPSALISRLPAPLTDGLRHGQRNTMYAEIENEGVTLVRRRDDGEYQASSANELTATGPVLERIAGTVFWRRKTTDAPGRNPQSSSSTDEQPGPSTNKRPRLDEDDSDLAQAHPLLSDLLTQPASPIDLSSALWKNWGSSTKPQSANSIEIEGLHYRVVPQGSLANTEVALMEHPRFSPSRYEAFEEMLQDDLSLQPRWAVKQNGEWKVPDNLYPFDKSLTGYIAETFRDYSDETLNTVARTLFNRADHSEVINSRGLMVLKQTFRNWANASSATIPRRELADPLLMLPVITRTTNTGWLALPPSDAAVTLRRLDFAPHRFPEEWRNFSANPSNFNLKRLVATVLVRNGYSVFPLTNEHQGSTLVFTRANHDAVFFLKLGRVEGHAIRDITPPGNELSDPHLTARIGEQARTALLTAHDQNKVVWLLGGTQITASGWQSVFIIRER